MESQTTHLVLARKYRPQKFSDVIEQKAAVLAIKNAILSDRLGSAYLFFGPRGVGKTTIARILAKRVNCLNPQGEEPCSECENCIAITSGSSMDVLEIDAASHRGIHHIRELRENINFRPMTGSKKVYIIDEVHMLTNESFNALLKTLEEPPEHVLFILATTEFNKIPETILSRCQVFNFRKAPLQVIIDYLKELTVKEEISADEESLFWIARKGDGSIRDSLSFMEQAITYCGGEITAPKVKELIGAIPMDSFFELTSLLLNRESTSESIIRPVHELFIGGGDLNRFIWEYLDFLRTLILLHQGIESPEILGIWRTDIVALKKEFSTADSIKISAIFEGIYKLLADSMALRLRNSYETRILIELSLFSIKEKLNRPSLTGVLQSLNELSATLNALEDLPSVSETDAVKKENFGADKTESAQNISNVKTPSSKEDTPDNDNRVKEKTYSVENELQKKFLGTVMSPDSVPRIDTD